MSVPHVERVNMLSADRIEFEKDINKDEDLFKKNCDKDTMNSILLYMRDVMNCVQISREEEIETAKQIEEGNEDAKEKLINSNLWAVYAIARKYQNRGLPLMDLIQEGNIGLLYAVNHYDYRKDVKFLTYATFWIKKQIQTAIAEQGSLYKLNLPKLYTYYRIKITRSNLDRLYGRSVSLPELSEEMNISEDYIGNILTLFENPVNYDDLTDSQINGADNLRHNQVLPEEMILNLEREKKVSELFSVLSPQEEKVIRMYFGFGGGGRMNTSQISKCLNISRQRVSSLKNRAISKIKGDIRKEDYDFFY